LKKSVIFMVLLMLGLAGVSTAQAQTIVVVDIGKVIEQSPQWQSMQKVLQADYDKRSKTFSAEASKIKKLEDQLEKDRDVMSSTEVTRQEQDIRSRRRKLSYDQGEARDDINMRIAEERRKLTLQAVELSKEIGKEMKVDLILASGVVYYKESIDITDKVLQRLKEKGKSK
jgi:Skp family chaperone for outer membrane proteins